MKDTILNTLRDLESAHDVTILYACESGSRGWGFPSTDSDYDVRFIYVHKPDHYLSIDSHKDVLDLPVDAVLDVGGWDLKKTLRLLHSSNAALFEWLQSPIIYQEVPGFLTEVGTLMKAHFNPNAALHHYLGIAGNAWNNRMVGDQMKIKKYCYVLRCVLAAKWIVERNSIPPMELQHLLPLISENTAALTAIERLLTVKATANEKTLMDPVPVLDALIMQAFESCEAATSSIAVRHSTTESLNDFFRATLKTFQ